MILKAMTDLLIVLDNIQWCVGSGNGIDFWFDPCLEDVGSLINHVVAAGAIGLTGTWLIAMGNGVGVGFDQLLPMDILLRITATKGPMMAYSALINRDWEVRTQCVARSGNVVPDGMAKLSDGRSLHIGRFPEPPTAIGSLLLLDSATLDVVVSEHG
ncbi:hypothetical protein V6N13_098442 [Hibiscus sabdariffa]